MDKKINIFNELNELEATILINTGNENYYSLPADYFNNLADNIKLKVFIQSFPAVNTYTIPASYFENFADIVLEKIQANAAGLNTSKQTAYTTPQGYFDNFADTVLQKIKYPALAVQQELEEISPLLSSIGKTNVYTVPENYFSHLKALPEQEILPETKVVSIKSKTRKWFSYAAAACLAAVLFGGGYFYYTGNKTNSVIQPSTPSFASVDVQKEISTLSDDEINNYLKNNNNIAVYTNTNDEDQKSNMDVQMLLQNVSDKEINDYLSNDPESHETGGGI